MGIERDWCVLHHYWNRLVVAENSGPSLGHLGIGNASNMAPMLRCWLSNCLADDGLQLRHDARGERLG
jgi:hypothetical protein